MKITQEYEESDIDLDNKLHGVLSISILVSSLIMTPKEIDHINDKVGHEKAVKAGIVTFLNMLNKSGFTISSKEEIPEVFRSI